MICCCNGRDFELILSIINDGAQAYKGIIPADRWTEPYMSGKALKHEIDEGFVFWCFEEASTLRRYGPSRGAGCNSRPACVCAHQPLEERDRCTIVVSFAGADEQAGINWNLGDAIWAIRFYERHGFQMVDTQEKNRLLEKYWTVPKRQVETSVVLVDAKWRALSKEVIK